MWFHYIRPIKSVISYIRWTTFPGSENEVMSERVHSSDGINSIRIHVSVFATLDYTFYNPLKLCFNMWQLRIHKPNRESCFGVSRGLQQHSPAPADTGDHDPSQHSLAPANAGAEGSFKIKRAGGWTLEVALVTATLAQHPPAPADAGQGVVGL